MGLNKKKHLHASKPETAYLTILSRKADHVSSTATNVTALSPSDSAYSRITSRFYVNLHLRRSAVSKTVSCDTDTEKEER